MRACFTLVPAALSALVQPAPALAESFLSVEEAQAILFPGASFQAAHMRLSPAQSAQLRAASKAVVYGPAVRVWRVSTGGWFYVDQVLGKDDRITYAVALDATGKVLSVEILVCDANYDDVRNPAWLRQFRGRRAGQGHLGGDVRTISGTTLSSAHIADGVTRILATHALFIARRAG